MSMIDMNVAESVLGGIVSINETRRNLDSSIDERRCFKLSQEDVLKSKSSFSYNVGKVSDGKVIRLQESEIYFRLSVNICMINSNSSDDSFLYRSKDRCTLRKNSIRVYSNGFKIPDDEVLFYPTKSNVDVFIPLKYINQTDESEFIVEKINYSNVPYIHYYNKNTSSQLFNIEISQNDLSGISVKERNTMIFINKRLYTGTRTISFTGNTMNISIFQELNNVEIEIIVDPDIVFFFPGTQSQFDDKFIYEVPESYIDSIHGPLSKFACSFFIDGKRVLNTDIEQKGRLHFLYKTDLISNPVLSMYVSDRQLIEDTDSIFYGCDYYLYNMIGCNNITSYYKTGLSSTIFDDNISFDEVLNKNGDKFNRQLINNITKTYKELNSPSTKISYLLEDRPYLMRTFLENFSNEKYTYTVNYNGTDSFVYFGLPNTVGLNDKRNYDISINTYHVPSKDIEVISKNITDVFKIDSKYFAYGKNMVDITVVDELDVEYEEFIPSDISIVDGYNVLVVDTFNRAKYVENIHVLRKITKEENSDIKYINDHGVGYIPIKEVYIDITETGEIHIIFENIPTTEFIVYNSNFSCIYQHTKPLSSNVMDIEIPLYLGNESSPIPYIPRGKILVYAGNDKLINGIDYFIKHPENDDNTAGSFIVVTRSILPGTQFDIYFSNIKTNRLIDKPGYFYNNPYGLFYFSKLRYPISLDYMDIYINNKKLTYKDVDILSDKLIRIHSMNAPLYDLSIESSFNIEEFELEPYIQLYEEDEFELFIARLFKGVDFTKVYNPNDVNDEFNYNEIYESFINTVDSVGKRKNPTARENEWINSDSESGLLGLYDDGTLMGGEDINTSLVAGGYAYFAGGKGRVCSINLASLEKNKYDSSSQLCNEGSFVDYSDITSSLFYKNYIIFGTRDGQIALFDISSKIWYNSFSQSFPLNLNKLTSDNFNNNTIRKIISVEEFNIIIIVGNNGCVASYSFNTDTWYGINDNQYNKVATVNGIMGNIYDCYLEKINEKNILVVSGEDGKICSCLIETNAWVKPNGERLVNTKPAPQIFNNGSHRENNDIYSSCDYLNLRIYSGQNGYVSFYDKNTKTYSVGQTDSRNIADDGSHSVFENNNVLFNYEFSKIVSGSNLGRVSCYVGDNQSWRNHLFGANITNDGSSMQYNNIYTSFYTIGETNYIVFSGAGGKICSYNVDVHEVPYRYDPYKTAFLRYYTTPGSEIIDTRFGIRESLVKKLSIYKDSQSTSYDICIKPGDVDLISDIYMNDLNRYPRELYRRRQFILDFIEALPPGRYTADQVYDLYINSDNKNKLYVRDFITLRGGDEIEQIDNLRIT